MGSEKSSSNLSRSTERSSSRLIKPFKCGIVWQRPVLHFNRLSSSMPRSVIDRFPLPPPPPPPKKKEQKFNQRRKKKREFYRIDKFHYLVGAWHIKKTGEFNIRKRTFPYKWPVIKRIFCSPRIRFLRSASKIWLFPPSWFEWTSSSFVLPAFPNRPIPFRMDFPCE